MDIELEDNKQFISNIPRIENFTFHSDIYHEFVSSTQNVIKIKFINFLSMFSTIPSSCLFSNNLLIVFFFLNFFLYFSIVKLSILK